MNEHTLVGMFTDVEYAQQGDRHDLSVNPHPTVRCAETPCLHATCQVSCSLFLIYECDKCVWCPPSICLHKFKSLASDPWVAREEGLGGRGKEGAQGGILDGVIHILLVTQLFLYQCVVNMCVCVCVCVTLYELLCVCVCHCLCLCLCVCLYHYVCVKSYIYKGEDEVVVQSWLFQFGTHVCGSYGYCWYHLIPGFDLMDRHCSGSHWVMDWFWQNGCAVFMFVCIH